MIKSMLISALIAWALQTAVAAEPSQQQPTINGDLSLIRLPLCRQSTDYSCGAAALQSVLAYYGCELPEAQLMRSLRTNSRVGTSFDRMATCCRRQGFEVEIKRDLSLDDLKGYLARQQPVICAIQAWPGRQLDWSKDWDDGHYVVAVGQDRFNIYFMDPWTLGNYT